MENLRRPHVILGVDGSLSGLAALRTAVAEARRRGLPLLAVREARILRGWHLRQRDLWHQFEHATPRDTAGTAGEARFP